MEPNKLEQDFKQKLEQRTIQPTEMAWDRLDAMLTVAEKKKKPNRTWMYMAASFLALLLVGTLFLNREKNTENGTINNNSVVNTESPISKEDSNVQQIIATPVRPQDAVVTTASPVKNAETYKATSTVKNRNTTKPNTGSTPGTTATPNEGLVANEAPEQPKLSRLSVDANALLASVESPETATAGTINTKIKQSTVKVSANTLLTSVEGELNESFRDKVIETVSKNFNKVKSSVASRNHE